MTRHLIDDYGHVAQTVPLADEWSDAFPPGPLPMLTRDEWREALTLLTNLPDLVGPVPAEINAMLQTLIHRRDGASAFLLRGLRSLDTEARA